MMIDRILAAYDTGLDAWNARPIGAGLIHQTWAICDAQDQPRFILQELNTQVFKRPLDIAQNLHILGDYLALHQPDYLLPLPIPTISGQAMAVMDNRYYRLTPFVTGSTVFNTCMSPNQAYEAAKQFGRFSAVFSGLDMRLLRETIPGFHNLSGRWTQFSKAVEEAIPERLQEAKAAVRSLQDQYPLVERYQRIQASPAFNTLVIHHDTKISNVLFDARGKGLCVIDLDTVMPGYFISDVGDMMRTYLSPANEEESDLQRVGVRPDFYTAIREGYLEMMADHLSPEEKDHFFFAGEFLIYMQALRFLADFLVGDPYYGAAYEGHNLHRARNQLALLSDYQRLTESVGGSR